MSDSASIFALLSFFGVLALGGAVLTILRCWLSDGTLDGGMAIALLGGLLALTTLAIKSASPLLMSLMILAVFGGTVLLPFLSTLNERAALNRQREEELARYRNAVTANPQFAAAWREMAEVYMRMNRYDDAIAAYKEAIRLNPPDVQKLRRRLNAAIEYRAGMPRVATLSCDHCGKETPKAVRCIHCGSLLELEFLDWILQRENLCEVLRPVMAITSGAVAVLVIFTPLSIAIKVTIVSVAMLVSGWLLWRIVKEI